MVAKRISQLDMAAEKEKEEAEVAEAKRVPTEHQAAKVKEKATVVTGFPLVIAGAEMIVLSNTVLA